MRQQIRCDGHATTNAVVVGIIPCRSLRTAARVWADHRCDQRLTGH
jgi:hypothetical protein